MTIDREPAQSSMDTLASLIITNPLTQLLLDGDVKILPSLSLFKVLFAIHVSLGDSYRLV